MTDARMKAYSTRRHRKPPPEFETMFVERGWCVVNRMYGKRAAVRYFVQLGPQRLRSARDAFVKGAMA